MTTHERKQAIKILNGIEDIEVLDTENDGKVVWLYLPSGSIPTDYTPALDVIGLKQFCTSFHTPPRICFRFIERGTEQRFYELAQQGIAFVDKALNKDSLKIEKSEPEIKSAISLNEIDSIALLDKLPYKIFSSEGVSVVLSVPKHTLLLPYEAALKTLKLEDCASWVEVNGQYEIHFNFAHLGTESLFEEHALKGLRFIDNALKLPAVPEVLASKIMSALSFFRQPETKRRKVEGGVEVSRHSISDSRNLYDAVTALIDRGHYEFRGRNLSGEPTAFITDSAVEALYLRYRYRPNLEKYDVKTGAQDELKKEAVSLLNSFSPPLYWYSDKIKNNEGNIARLTLNFETPSGANVFIRQYLSPVIGDKTTLCRPEAVTTVTGKILYRIQATREVINELAIAGVNLAKVWLRFNPLSADEPISALR